MSIKDKLPHPFSKKKKTATASTSAVSSSAVSAPTSGIVTQAEDAAKKVAYTIDNFYVDMRQVKRGTLTIEQLYKKIFP
ncbi:MAG: hypothetical protein QXL94_00445 [Candidatus Parvarchaeum sp.]